MWCQERQNSANRSQKSLTRPKHGEPVIPRRAPKPLQGAGDPSGEEGFKRSPDLGKWTEAPGVRSRELCTLYFYSLLCALSTLYSLPTLYSLICTLYSVLCTLYSVLCTLFCVLCAHLKRTL